MAHDNAQRPDGAGPDWTIPQEWGRYTAVEYALWDTLFARPAAMLPGRAVLAFLAGFDILRPSKPGIPDFGELSERLMAATGWQVVAVPGLVERQCSSNISRTGASSPALHSHARTDRLPAGARRFIQRPRAPAAPRQFGFADYMQAYGVGGQRATALGAIDKLSRLYFYTVELGLIRTGKNLKIHGAGIVSSYARSVFALDDQSSNRLGFDLRRLMRLMRTRYRIDDYQQNYLVIDSFEDLLRQTPATDFGPIYAELEGQSDIETEAILSSDALITRGRKAYVHGEMAAA